MQLIVNADDFGLSEGVNRGIIEAFQRGIVRSTTLMVGMPAVPHAVELSRQNPALKVGVHLRLTAGFPEASSVPGLLGSDGQFQHQGLFWDNQSMNSEEIERELRAQIENFLAYDIPLSHLDGHHHCHRHPQVAPIANKLAEEYGVPIRPCHEPVLYNGTRLSFSDAFYGDQLSMDHLLEIVGRHKDQTQVLEIMSHPAIVDKGLGSASSYTQARAEELKVLTDPLLKKALQSMGVAITDYGCLK
ncbi:chitin disaccharide deacetylase [Endozoicomonas sp. Mp262]|uniref:chitin disaccharide deacetylase n=1 Tax=Endozoicomonas sp. Mp262 TaxID=2919499 RepID=UPI0021E0EDAF